MVSWHGPIVAIASAEPEVRKVFWTGGIKCFSCGNLARKSRPNSPCAAMPIGHQSQRIATKPPEQIGSYQRPPLLSGALRNSRLPDFSEDMTVMIVHLIVKFRTA